MYQFTDDCRIGIPEIDEEHETLFSLVNQAYSLLSEDQDLRKNSAIMLMHLKEYANTHFAHEEDYMKKIDDPELPSQQQEHWAFSQRMNAIDFSRLTDAQIKPAFTQLLDFLSRWLFRHILGSDTLIGKNESPFAFTSKYLTGVEFIDEEHCNLFRMIKKTYDIIHDDFLFDKYDETVAILNELKEYTLNHFDHEEALMREIQYPGLEKQLAAHQTFREKLAEIQLDEVDENQQEHLENLIQFLLNWLSVHIMGMDKAIGEFRDNS